MKTRVFRYALAALLAVLLPASGILMGAEPRLAVPNKYEEEAVAAGNQLGIGSAVLEGPKSVEVLSHQTWTLVYTAGKAGIEPGGGIRIGMRHLCQWSPPQTEDPNGVGYLTVKTSNDAPVKVSVDLRRRFFLPYFAWHNMVEVILPEQGLPAGQTIRLTYGDRAQGSPGIRVQPFDEPRFVFKVYVDAPGGGDYLPLAESPAVEVVAAEPCRLAVVMPSDAVAGEPTRCLVRAEDRYGNPAPRYRGTIQWKSTDPGARLPGTYSFAETDGGAHRFENVVFQAVGTHTITVTDGALAATGNPVRVSGSRPERLLLWGDLHGHTLQSDGRGTVEEYYDFAQRVVGLDFCAVSDHAFELVDEMWEHSKAVTNRLNRPGRFVTFNAFEWSGNTDVGGDHNVYFLGDDPPLYRSDNYYDPTNLQMYHGPEPKVAHVEDLLAKLEERLATEKAICIPHWGGRHGNPEFHNPKVERLIEIFSEHRRSEDWVTKFLAGGHRVGIMASGDDHYGNPGLGYLRPSYEWAGQEIGMAAVAVYAEEHTRESIFQALYDRRCYATSGDRIVLDFQGDGHPMGSEYRTATPPTLSVIAVGTAPISQVEIKKNSRVIFSSGPNATNVSLKWRDDAFQPKGPCYYYVRVIQDDQEEAISSPIWVN
ncbi:MAG TPA: DUF3604 domain-containing protein [Thermoguttaceae bacterium]|nr:DUF3604 domain-containing protein [Thermoguttaceae bacterium]